MDAERVWVYDTTLRDGLRNSGVALADAGKVELACALEALGVDAIEVGFGGPTQVEPMQLLARSVQAPAVFGLTRVNRTDVERVLRGVEPAARPGVNVYQPASDQFLASVGVSRDQAVDRLGRAISLARSHVDEVMYATQDATRADPGFLMELCRTAVSAGCSAVSVADTVSHALPDEFAALCHDVGAAVASGEVRVSVHCHNAIGLAVANCLAAVGAGARMVECTVNGIGEGAGNAPLQAVIGALAARADAFPAVASGVRSDRLAAIGPLLDALAQRAPLRGAPVAFSDAPAAD